MTKSNILLWSAVLLILALLEGLNVQVAIVVYLTWRIIERNYKMEWLLILYFWTDETSQVVTIDHFPTEIACLEAFENMGISTNPYDKAKISKDSIWYRDPPNRRGFCVPSPLTQE